MRKQYTSLHHRELTLLLVILVALFTISLFSTYHSSGAFLGFKIGAGIGKDIDVIAPSPVPFPEKEVDITVKGPVTQKALAQFGFTSRFTPTGELSEISNSYGKIRFDQPLSVASLSASSFRDVDLRQNYAFIDTSSDRFQLFVNTAAEITLYNVPWFPGVSSFVQYSNIGQSLPCPECTLLHFDAASVTFHVSGFSGYGVNNPSAPSQSQVVLNATTSFITTHDDLKCHSLNTIDPDGDPLVMNYQYIVNGVNYSALALPFDVNTSSLAAGAVYDFSGNNRSGILGNGFSTQAPRWVGQTDAKKGGAYQFDGIDDFILLPINSFAAVHPGLTVEAWIKLKSNYDYSVVFADGYYNMGGFSLGTNDGTDLAFFAVKTGAGLFMVTYPFSILTLDTYHHLAGVHDGIQHTLSLYIDGVLVNQSIGPGPAGGSSMGTEIPSIGVDWLRDVLNRQMDSSFEGIIDELSIFNRALSSAEIDKHSQLQYDLIDEEETTMGETWSCIAVPTDGYYVGYSNESAPITIGSNQIPTHSPPYLSTSSGQNITSDSLFCLPQGVTDVEGYPLRNVTSFIINGNASDVLFLPFDKNDYSYAEDFSGNNLNGTVNGALFQETGGRVRGAYQFDGVNDFISVADSSLLDFDNFTDFSIEFWMNPSFLEDVTLLTKGNTYAEQGYGIFMTAAGNLVFRLRDSQDVFSLTSLAPVAVPQAYTHVVVTVDRDGFAVMYANGQIVATQAVLGSSGSIIGNVSTDYPLVFSQDISPFALMYQGLLDEAHIYSYLLTPAQVLVRYALQEHYFDHTMTSKGQSLSCAITPHDSFVRGIRLLSQNITILNSPPTHVNPSLISTSGQALDTDDLTCLQQNSQDLDQDPLRHVYTYVLNDLPITILSLPFESQPTASTQIFDYSLYGNNGTVNGALYNATGGKLGGAYQFDGINDFMVIPDDPSLDLLYDISMDMWVKFSSFSNHQPLLIKDSDVIGVNATNYGLRTGGNTTGTAPNQLEFIFDTNTTTNIYSTTGAGLQLNQWHHVAVVKPYLSSPEIYIDGILQTGQCTSGYCALALQDSNAALRIGRGVVEDSRHYFHGMLDEVRVYDLPLTSLQINEYLTLNYQYLTEDMTYPGDQWYCAVTPHDTESDGLTKFSSTLDILDSGSSNTGFGGTGSPYQYSFDWYVDEEPTVTYTLQTTWEINIHNVLPQPFYPLVYDLTFVTSDYHNGKVHLMIAPGVGPLAVYENTPLYVDLNEDGQDDISIEAYDLGYQTATFTLTSLFEGEPEYIPVDIPDDHDDRESTSPVEPVQEQQPLEEPALETPSAPLIRNTWWKGNFDFNDLPYRSIIISLLVILILVTFSRLMKKVKTG